MISVIIPNYNHQAFLAERIDSILNQTYQDFEIIILDDCSTDNSKEIIEQYRHNEKISAIVYNEKNSGSTFRQWEKGIELATGDWIWIAESDDYAEASLLETLVSNIDDTYAVAYAQTLTFTSTGKVAWISTADFIEETVSGRHFVDRKMLPDNTLFNASMAIFRKDLYANIDKGFTKYKFCGDWLFWMEIGLQGKVFISGKVLNYFRKHDKDISSKSIRTGLFYEEFLDLLNELVAKKIISSERKQEVLIKQYIDLFQDTDLEKAPRRLLLSKYDKAVGSFQTVAYYHTRQWWRKVRGI